MPDQGGSSMDPSQLQSLVKPELFAVGTTFVIVFQIVWRIFADEANSLPAFPRWIVPALMVPVAFGLAFRYQVIHPADPAAAKTLADDWATQGAFLLGTMLIAYFGLATAFSTPAASGETSKSSSSGGGAL